jgi:hypothetical protein
MIKISMPENEGEMAHSYLRASRGCHAGWSGWLRSA